MEKNKINFYDLEIEIEVDNTTNISYKNSINSMMNEYNQSFLSNQKSKILDKVCDFKDKNNFKEKFKLKFFPATEGQNLIFNEKIIDKSFILSLEELVKILREEKVKIKDKEIIFNLNNIGTFKGSINDTRLNNGEYNLKVINTKVITSETNITGLKIILSSRKEIVNHLLNNLKTEKSLFNIKEEEALKHHFINPVSEKNYNGVNKLRLSLEAAKKNYKDPRWITFNQANSKGWKIKKGEKGTLCEKIVFHKDENGKKIPLEKPFLAYYTVFNAEQIEGIPPLKLKNIEKNSEEKINNILNNLNIKIKESDYNQVYYNSKDRSITISKDFDKKNYSMAILEEIIHSTAYDLRFKELNSEENNFKETISKEHLTTKLTTLFLQTDLNLAGNNNINNDYIKELLEKDYNQLFRSCYRAEKATKYILDNSFSSEKKTNKLEVIFHNSNIDLNLDNNTILTEKKALDFLEKINNLKEGNIKISISLGDFQYKNLNIDLSSNELGNYSNISDKLNYRFNTYIDFVEEKFIKSEKITEEEVKKYFKSNLTKEQIYEKLILTREKINNFSVNLRKKQNLLQSEMKKEKTRETRSRTRSKNNGNER